MPSQFAEPTLAELLQAFRDGVRGSDRYGDTHSGAVYDHFNGIAAIMWSREARRDTDMWRAIYFASAEGKSLTALLDERYGFSRLQDTYGTGSAMLARPTAAAADGTIWKGTRIVIASPFANSKRYIVIADVPVGTSELTAVVPIRADVTGTGVAITLDAETIGFASVEDPLWDTSWTVTSLTCADGTSFESAPTARARFKDLRQTSRPGFVDALMLAAENAGATEAIFFSSDYGGDDVDFGLNMAYVGAAGFAASDQLVRNVQASIEDWRVLGDNLQVRPMAPSRLQIQADVNLWTSPSRVNQTQLRTVLVGALLGYFNGATSGFSYNRDAMVGAMLRASSAVQFVTFDEPSSDTQVLATVGGLPNFPATLTRYLLSDSDIVLNFLPPA